MATKRTKKIMIGVGILLTLAGFIIMSFSKTIYATLLGSCFIGGGVGSMIGPLMEKKE